MSRRTGVPHVGWFSVRDGGVSKVPVRTVQEGIRQGKRLVNEDEHVSHAWVTGGDGHLVWHSDAPEREVSTGNSGDRAPDSVTYNLGHNETMQLGVCVSLIADLLRELDASADDNRDSDEQWVEALVKSIEGESIDGLSLETLAFFEGIFNLPGLVTLTKDSDD